MPSIRIGFATDINLVNEQVGIGTTNPTARLDVRGQIRANNSAGSGGITTFTTYDGFLHSQQNLTNSISIASTTRGNLNSLSGEIKITGEVTVSDGTPITGGRLDSLTVTGSFDLPSSGSAGRELKPEKGSTRFNQDLGQLEFYTGTEWRTTASYDGSGRGRGVFGSGTGNSQLIEYVNISTQGNSINFGTLTVSHDTQPGSCASSIRGIFAGGSPVTNVIDYITIASEGNAIDFGDLTVARLYFSGSSSSTRGIFAGGFTPTPTNTYLNIIDYVTIASIGNALDFGDLIATRLANASCSSPTRSVIFSAEANVLNTIQFVTIASTGNAIRFGELNVTKTTYNGSFSSSTRGVSCGGYSTIPINVIEYVTIATTGNAIYFGDLTGSNRFATAGASSNTRGLCGGGGNPGSSVNIIDFVTIANTANAQDFGDLVASRGYLAALSDSHGGLGGF
jgi:hypothetical protein